MIPSFAKPFQPVVADPEYEGGSNEEWFNHGLDNRPRTWRVGGLNEAII